MDTMVCAGLRSILHYFFGGFLMIYRGGNKTGLGNRNTGSLGTTSLPKGVGIEIDTVLFLAIWERILLRF